MRTQSYPTEPEIRGALIRRMEAHCRKAGVSPSTVCREVMYDTSFFAKVTNGLNFTVGSYQRLHDYFDRAAMAPPPPKKKTNGHARKKR